MWRAILISTALFSICFLYAQNPDSLHRIISALYAGCGGSKNAPSTTNATTTTTTTDTTAHDAGCPNTDNGDVDAGRANRAPDDDAQRQNNLRRAEALPLTSMLGTINNANAATTATTADVIGGNDDGGGFETPMMMDGRLASGAKQVATVSGSGKG